MLLGLFIEGSWENLNTVWNFAPLKVRWSFLKKEIWKAGDLMFPLNLYLICLLKSHFCFSLLGKSFIVIISMFLHFYVRIQLLQQISQCICGIFFALWTWFVQDEEDSRLMTIRLWNWIFCKQTDYTLLVVKVTFIFEKMIFECAADSLSTAGPRARQETNMSNIF